MQQIESIKEFGGYLNRYIHQSDSCHCEMTFSVYLPPQVSAGKVPTLSLQKPVVADRRRTSSHNDSYPIDGYND